jgi:hypothetical protein
VVRNGTIAVSDEALSAGRRDGLALPTEGRGGRRRRVALSRTAESSDGTRGPDATHANRHQNAEIEANLTPMIDVSFLLIVFFALVSGIRTESRRPCRFPTYGLGAATRPDDDARWVLNVLPARPARAPDTR